MRTLDNMGKITNNMNGNEMLTFLGHNKIETLNDRVKKAEPEWTRRCILKGENYVLDYIMLESECGKET